MAENDGKKAKSSKSPLLAILIGIVALGAGGGATYYFLRSSKVPKEAAAAAPEKKEVKSTLSLEPFLVNLADKEEIRFVKATFQLGLEEEKVEKEGSSNAVFLAQTRDAIISLLSSKTSEEILTNEGKEKLREEIRKKVNGLLVHGKIAEVYIVDFVVQL